MARELSGFSPDMFMIVIQTLLERYNLSFDN